MSQIFLSHSGKDARAAIALQQWLVEQRPQLANEIFLHSARRHATVEKYIHRHQGAVDGISDGLGFEP
jgi:hypothetical protein